MLSIGKSPLFRLRRLHGSTLQSLGLLRRPLPDIPAPTSQSLNDLRRKRCGEWHADEDE